jgi:branched-chain amino acid transport system substrate-binding protein
MDAASGRSITRRDFLKAAGVAGAALGAGGGLGAIASACGSGTSTSNSSAGSTGREIKIGFVAPITGPLAAFGQPDHYCAERWAEAVKDGVTINGKTHKVTILLRDSQSDTNRAATVAGDLISNDGVDIIMAASTADTVPPVADQAEALQTPCITNDCPWQSYFFGRGGNPDKPFKWTYHSWWGLEDITAVFIDMWNQIPNNKKVGEMWPNDGDGLAWANPTKGQPPFFKAGGYAIVDPGRYQDGTPDFTVQIAKFKGGGNDIVSGVMIPPDFTNFWKQSMQQGFKPKIATVGKALLFPTSLEALGPMGTNLSSECWWTPTHPFKSSLTGETCQQLADDYTKRTGKQWTQPLLHYAIFETVVDVLKRTQNIDDKESILKAIVETDMQTIGGRITWTGDAKLNPVKNVCKTPIVGGQWVKGDKWPFEIKVVSNSLYPEIKTAAKFQEITY